MGDSQGFSILSVVVALGLAGILMVVINKMLNQQRKVMAQIKWQGEKDEMRTGIKKIILCELGCDEASKAIPEKMGRWLLKGQCDSDGLRIETRRLNRFDKPARHPLTEKLSDWEPLFPRSDPYLCGTQTGHTGGQQAPEDENYQYTPSPRETSGTSSAGNPESIIAPHQAPDAGDQEALERAVQQTKDALQKLCPTGKTLRGIDTETMNVICE